MLVAFVIIMYIMIALATYGTFKALFGLVDERTELDERLGEVHYILMGAFWPIMWTLYSVVMFTFMMASFYGKIKRKFKNVNRV